MDKLNMQTTNIVDGNIKRIGELFPNCLTEQLNDEGKPEVAIDFDQLRQEKHRDKAVDRRVITKIKNELNVRYF